MSICTNTTPISSRYDDLTAPIGPIDFSALLSRPNPLDNVDRQTVVDLTNGLNNVLDLEDTSQYPTLNARFNQFPLTYTEIAEFVLENAIDPVSALNEVNKYNGGMPANAPIFDLFDDLDLFYTDNYGKTVSEGLCGSFGNTLTDLLGLFTLLDSTLDKLASLKLDDLDPKKLATQLAQKLKLDAILESIQKTIDDLIDKALKKLDKVFGGLLDELSDLAANPGKTIGSYLTKLREEVKEFFSKENRERIKNSIQKFIAELTSNFERITISNVLMFMYILCNFTEIILSLIFAPLEEAAEIKKNIKKEKEVLDATDKNALAVAQKNGAIRCLEEVCIIKREEVGVTINQNAIDGNNPNAYTVREVVLNQRGQPSSFKTVVKFRQPGELGYVDPETYSYKIDGNMDYITSEGITPEEQKEINTMAEYTLGPNRNVLRPVYMEEKEWREIAPIVLAKLMRISFQTGKPVTVIQGAVQPRLRKNVKQAGKIRNQGMDGYHHKYSGFAVKIFVEEKNRDETIIAASRAGFTGIGVGKTELRLHVGNREGYVGTTDDPRWKPEDQFTADSQEALLYEQMMITHRRDGYRRKRTNTTSDEFRFYDRSTFKAEKDNTGNTIFTENTDPLSSSSSTNDDDTEFRFFDTPTF